jgi:hypothetical protein
MTAILILSFDMAPQAAVRHDPTARSKNAGLIIWFHCDAGTIRVQPQYLFPRDNAVRRNEPHGERPPLGGFFFARNSWRPLRRAMSPVGTFRTYADRPPMSASSGTSGPPNFARSGLKMTHVGLLLPARYDGFVILVSVRY